MNGQFGTVTVLKYGERLKGAETGKMVQKFPEGTADFYTLFQYEEAPLEGVVFRLVCDEDIDASDLLTVKTGEWATNRRPETLIRKGTVIETVLTDLSGKAMWTDVPYGKYHIEEVQAADGYVRSGRIDAFVLKHGEHNRHDTKMPLYESIFQNERQKISICLKKVSSETGSAIEGAVYGLYTAETIYDAGHQPVLKEDSLIESGRTDRDGALRFLADLPLGKYYVQEIEAPPGYMLDIERYIIDASYQGQETDLIEKEILIQEIQIKQTKNETVQDVVGLTENNIHYTKITENCM